MRRTPLTKYWGLLASAITVAVLIGCNGSRGSTGATGATGATGSNGSTAAVNIGAMTSAEWAALKLQGSVTNVNLNGGQPIVTFKVTNAQGVPLVGLGGADPSGFSSHLGFAIAKLVTTTNPTPSDGAVIPSTWVNFGFVTPPTTTGGTPTVTSYPDPEFVAANLTDNLDGTYTYKFNVDMSKTQAQATQASASFSGNQALADLGDLSYDPSSTFRILILAGGAPNYSGSIPAPTAVLQSANITYDFVGTTPNTPLATVNEVVATATCNGCHTKLAMHSAYMAPVREPKACVVCHTDQMKFGFADARDSVSGTTTPTFTTSTFKLDGRAVGLFPNLIHKIHMGTGLGIAAYDFDGAPMNGAVSTQYPQDIRNCNTCHTGTAATTIPASVTVNGVSAKWPTAAPIATVTSNGDYWNMAPGRAACGACHDTTIFSTNVNHGDGITTNYTDDTKCGTCHTAAEIKVAHWPVYAPSTATVVNPLNASLTTMRASNPYTLPTGLTGGTVHPLTWAVSKVIVNSSFNPEITLAFFKDNSSTITPVNTYASGGTVMIPNFSGAPSVYIYMGVPQDGITNPSDYNYISSSISLLNVWNGTAGSMTYNSDGSVTAVLTGVTVPSTVNLLEAVVGFGFMTQTDAMGVDAYNFNSYANGLVIPTQAVAKTCTSFPSATAMTRRTILKADACLSCHENLGYFTEEAFHSGNYNHPEVCFACHNTVHNPDRVQTSINLKEWIHGIHSGGLNSSGTALAGLPTTPRVNAYTAHVTSGSAFWAIQYPALLNDCTQCHVDGAYNFGGTTNVAQVPNMLWSTVASGTLYNVNDATALASTTLVRLLAPPTVGTIPDLTTVSVGTAPKSTFASAGVLSDPALKSFLSSTTTTTLALGTLSSATSGVTAPSTTYVTSPITAACSSCHDGATAIAHYRSNGGVFYATRSSSYASGTTTLVNNEQCIMCHGAGAVADAKTVHMNF